MYARVAIEYRYREAPALTTSVKISICDTEPASGRKLRTSGVLKLSDSLRHKRPDGRPRRSLVGIYEFPNSQMRIRASASLTVQVV